MSRADDLLDLSRKMVGYTRTDLVEARVRRAISTAYYALFHLLLEHGVARVVTHPGLRLLVGRAYSHGDMIKSAKTFQSGGESLPTYLTAPFGGSVPHLPTQIRDVAKAFVVLQEARHAADYDLAKPFTHADAKKLVAHAEEAFTNWNAVVALPEHRDMCELFLATLLLGDRLKK